MKKLLLILVFTCCTSFSQQTANYYQAADMKQAVNSSLASINKSDLILYAEIASKFFTDEEIATICRLKIYDPFDNRYRSVPGFCYCLLNKTSKELSSTVNPIKAGLIYIINNDSLFNYKIIIKEGQMISFREYLQTMKKIIL